MAESLVHLRLATGQNRRLVLETLVADFIAELKPSLAIETRTYAQLTPGKSSSEPNPPRMRELGLGAVAAERRGLLVRVVPGEADRTSRASVYEAAKSR
jgi:hypothetical protein